MISQVTRVVKEDGQVLPRNRSEQNFPVNTCEEKSQDRVVDKIKRSHHPHIFIITCPAMHFLSASIMTKGIKRMKLK